MARTKPVPSHKRLRWQRRYTFVIIGVVIVIAVGVSAYHGRHRVLKTSVATTTVHSSQSTKLGPQPDPYDGWLSYTIPKSNLSFKYPSDWQLNPTTGPLGPWASPGTPETSLVAPNGLYIDILTDNDNRASEAGNSVLLSQQTETLGATDDIDYIDAVGDGNVTYAALLTGPSASSPYPSVTMPDGSSDRLIVSIAYQVKSGPNEEPLSKYQQDMTMAEAELVVSSLRDE